MENQTITVQDLIGLKETIDIACSRGAFRAAEMQQVGELYNKLSTFLEAVISASEPPAESSESDQSQGEVK